MKTISEPPGTFAIQHADQRFFADHGWLKTYHSFSFADYYEAKYVGGGPRRAGGSADRDNSQRRTGHAVRESERRGQKDDAAC